MRPRILLTVFVAVLFVILSGCGTVSNCPTCGTTTGGTYAVIDVIPVPEHNNTGTPGGPFNSFDISWIASNPSGSGDNLDYVSDRIGIAVQVIDTTTDLAVNSIAGQNGVSGAGDNASPCVPTIPPLVSVNGNFTRFGCRNPPFQLPSGFGPSGNFGGFTGAQCCAARSQGVNPMSGPDGIVVTNDGKTLFVGNGSSSVVVFDLTTNPPVVIADIPTGVSADYDGPQGLGPCLVSWQGEAGSSAFCGDDRGDEMSLDTTDQILAVINGDPGLPFITFIDVSGVIARTSNCLPIDPTTPYGPAALPFGSPVAGQSLSILPSTANGLNPPSCILGQIYYDGVPPSSTPVVVDNVNGPCPDPSNPTALSGVSGIGTTPNNTPYTIPCQHGPVLDNSTGSYSLCNPTPQAGSNCIAAISPAGLGAHAWDPATGYFLLSNANSTGITNVGNIDVINPKSPVGPVVINSFPMLNCMPTGITPGPGNNFLVGCADHDGEAFPANEYIITNTPSLNIACNMPPAPSTNCTVVTQTGGVDETWYNPGDNRYYLAARDMLPSPVMGVIDAKTNLWLYNLPVNTNAHSIAVDPNNNRVFMPQQSGAICGTQSGAGCIDVIAQQ
ncbi:MAG: hypothetical protein ABSA78_20925 [Candidatus Sulfotelmatobacter sp.]